MPPSPLANPTIDVNSVITKCDSDYSRRDSVTTEKTLSAEEEYSLSSSRSESINIETNLRKGKSQLDSAIEKPNSRRRRSFFGSSGACSQKVAYHENKNSETPLVQKKPTSSRRRSLFGSTTPDDFGLQETPKKPQSLRRRSFFGHASVETPIPADSIATPVASRSPSVRCRKTAPKKGKGGFLSPSTRPDQPIEKPKKLSRRSSNPSRSTLLDDPGVKPDIPGRGLFRSRNPTEREGEVGTSSGLLKDASHKKPSSFYQDRSLAIDVDPPPKPSSMYVKARGPSLCGSTQDESTHSRISRNSSFDSICGLFRDQRRSTGQSTKTGESTANQPFPSQNTEKDTAKFKFLTPLLPVSRRTKNPVSKDPCGNSESYATGTTESLRAESGHSQTSSSVSPVRVHDILNRSRAKRGLPDFSRNMLMDTLAKQVAQDLAASVGTHCTPTNYHGNVGQGETVRNILKTMLTQEGTARANILNPSFSEVGISMAKGKDGLIYMCQLFQ